MIDQKTAEREHRENPVKHDRFERKTSFPACIQSAIVKKSDPLLDSS
jgi:hypothetical protein